MRGAIVLMAAAPLVFVPVSHAAVPLGTTDIHGKWRMRGAVVHSQNGAPVGKRDRQTWRLKLLCADSCQVRATLGVNTAHPKVVLLSRAGSGNRYSGSLTAASACSGGVPGTITTQISLRPTKAKLLHARLVATEVLALVIARKECPAATTSTTRRYNGVPAG
jgi:hypothetical protein